MQTNSLQRFGSTVIPFVRTHVVLRVLGMAAVFFFVIGTSHLRALPVNFVVHGTFGASATGTACVPGAVATQPCGNDLLHAGGAGFTVASSIDTTATPVACTAPIPPLPPLAAGAVCNRYNVTNVQVSSTIPALASLGTLTLAGPLPVDITVNTGGNPDTFSLSFTVPIFNIPVSAIVGIPTGTISAPTPVGFGKIPMTGNAPYAFGSMLTYGQVKNGQNNITSLTMNGTVDGINVLHTFTATATDGGFPKSNLTEIARGLFVGTTFGSTSMGLNSNIFAISGLSGGLAVLHTFNPATEGTSAGGAMFQAVTAPAAGQPGYLYGVNATGGPATTGTVFKSDTKGNVTVPNSTMKVPLSLIGATDFNLYGVTSSATATNSFYKLSLGGTVTPLHTFTAAEGIPSGPVIQAANGNFYGETTGGSGASGMVYCMTKAGALTQVHAFTNGSDGANPSGGLLQASNGRLYGVASGGSGGSGVVFSLAPLGTSCAGVPSAPIIEHTFVSATDGATPSGGLMLATDNKLYGITSAGGLNSVGTVFQLTVATAPATAVFNVVHYFNGADGAQPQVDGPGLTQGSDGKLYGTASQAPPTSAGTVFSLDLKLPIPLPKIFSYFDTATGGAHGAVGSAVIISGKNLLGVTSVKFGGGVAATTVLPKSATCVIVLVPSGAITGPVMITTPAGITSNSPTFTIP